MNKIWLWFYLSCKRQLKRPFFLILLLAIPAGLWLFHQEETKSQDKISIALYTEGDEWNHQVVKELVKTPHSFEFYLTDSKEELIGDVTAKKAECGYIFPKGLKKKLDSGQYRRAILMVVSPSTVTAKLASETIFAGLFRVYGRDLLKHYSKTGKTFSETSRTMQRGASAWEELEPLFDKYLENGSTFAFEYKTVSGGTLEQESVKVVFPVRGIVAVFIFVMGLAAAVTSCEDQKRGLFMTVSNAKKAACMIAQLAAPVVFTCGCALLCLLVTGNVEQIGKELSTLFLYGLAVVLFSYLMIRILGNSLVIAGLIPFFIIGSLTACPVFMDLSVFLPVLKLVRYFFLPYYYLAL